MVNGLREAKYQPIDITFKNLKYSIVTDKGMKVILKDIEGICRSGEVTAILGIYPSLES